MMKKLIAQIMKFGIVGVLATLIDYIVLWILTEYAGLYYLASAAISFSVSVIFNYICSMRYVFVRKENADRRKEFVIFLVLSIIGLGMNQLLMWIGTDVLGIYYLIAKLFATALVMVYNFITRKLLLEQRD